MRRTTQMRSSILPVALIAALLALSGCSDKAEKPRKQQTVKLLPDTPPPPPPPPKPTEKQPPKAEDKPQPQAAPKPAEAPQPQSLKSDEAAGSGPGSGLTAGPVTQDYSGQKVVQGPVTVGGSAENRFAWYGALVKERIQEAMARDKKLSGAEYRVTVNVWISASGAVTRVELIGSTSNTELDNTLKAALNNLPPMREGAPGDMPQPIKLRITARG